MPRPSNMTKEQILQLVQQRRSGRGGPNADPQIDAFLADIDSQAGGIQDKIALRDIKRAEAQALQDEADALDRDIVLFEGGKFYAQNKIVDRHYELEDAQNPPA